MDYRTTDPTANTAAWSPAPRKYTPTDHFDGYLGYLDPLGAEYYKVQIKNGVVASVDQAPNPK
jgi:hypothetical protein